MAKLDLKKISVKDIISNKLMLISFEQLLDIVDNWELLEEYFYQKNYEINDRNVVEYITRHTENINKEKLIYVILKNLKKYGLDRERNTALERSKTTTNTYHKIYTRYLEMLKSSNVEIPVIKEKDGIYEIERFEDIRDLSNEPKDVRKEINLRKHNLQVLLNVQEKMPLEILLSMGPLEDFEKFICFYEGNGAAFKNLIIKNAKKMTQMEINQALQEGKKLSNNKKEESYFYHLIQQTKHFFENHIEKFNVEKFLLLCAYRARANLETSKSNNSIMIDIMRVADENIADPKLKVEGSISDGYDGKQSYIRYTKKQLSEDVSRIIGNQYFSKKELLETRQLLLSGKMKLGLIPDARAFSLFNFSGNQKLALIDKNHENFEQLVAFDALNQEETKEALEYLEDLKVNMLTLQKLYDNAHIEKRDILKLYMRNNIDFPNMLYLNERQDLTEEVTVQELMKYYTKMKEDEENTKDFNRYSLLFKELKTKGKTEEEQSNMAEQIMEELYKTDGDYEEDLKNLYRFDLLPIQSLIDWNGEEMIYDLIKSGELKPRDAKDLLVNDELDLRKVYDALKISRISETEKMSFIYSSFDGIGKTEEEIGKQNEARNYLIQVINVSQEVPEYSENNHQKQTRMKGENKQKRNQYITDPVHRWQLFSVLDEDCSSEIYADGTVIFTLPNVKGGTVVIEKMLKNTKNGNKPDYGVATYIMSQEEFYNNKDDIVQEKRINRKKLISLHEKNKADKVIHSTTWGKNLKKSLEIVPEKNYTQEKIVQIDKIVDRIKRARELVA